MCVCVCVLCLGNLLIFSHSASKLKGAGSVWEACDSVAKLPKGQLLLCALLTNIVVTLVAIL